MCTYSGEVALRRGQDALYVTERCVFRLTEGGLELVEIAPGIDLERDILSKMAFRPAVSAQLAVMDPAIFLSGPMGLREALLRVPLSQRFVLDPAQGIFFANFEGLVVRSIDDVEAIRTAIEERLVGLGRMVPALVDYDNFTVLPDVLDAYTDMVQDVASRHYSRVTRYTTSAFLRAKLGDALLERGVAPHIFESVADARKHLEALGETSSSRAPKPPAGSDETSTIRRTLPAVAASKEPPQSRARRPHPRKSGGLRYARLHLQFVAKWPGGCEGRRRVRMSTLPHFRFPLREAVSSLLPEWMRMRIRLARMRREWRRAGACSPCAQPPLPPSRLFIIPSDPRTPFGSRGDDAMLRSVVGTLRARRADLRVSMSAFSRCRRGCRRAHSCGAGDIDPCRLCRRHPQDKAGRVGGPRCGRHGWPLRSSVHCAAAAGRRPDGSRRRTHRHHGLQLQ